MPAKIWTKTFENVPYFEKIRVDRRDMDSHMGPFGGGWTTKFSLLIGSSRNVIEFWRYSISFYKPKND